MVLIHPICLSPVFQMMATAVGVMAIGIMTMNSSALLKRNFMLSMSASARASTYCKMMDRKTNSPVLSMAIPNSPSTKM